MFYLSFMVSLCVCAVGRLTGCVLVVAIVFVVQLCRDLTTTESRVKVLRL